MYASKFWHSKIYTSKRRNMISFEEEKIVSIERARELLQGTELENASDEDLNLFIESIKQFCEINFELYQYQQNNMLLPKEMEIDKLEETPNKLKLNKLPSKWGISL